MCNGVGGGHIRYGGSPKAFRVSLSGRRRGGLSPGCPPEGVRWGRGREQGREWGQKAAGAGLGAAWGWGGAGAMVRGQAEQGGWVKAGVGAPPAVQAACLGTRGRRG